MQPALSHSFTPKPSPMVYVVDDDEAVRDAVAALLGSVSLDCNTFASAEDLLAAANPAMRGCLLLDVRMPGMSGLELQQRLQDHGILLPVIILTGHGDVPMAVRALKAGATDFIEKPFNEQDMLDRIKKYMRDDEDGWQARQTREEAVARFAPLTPRELAVMALIASGKHAKEIAFELDIQSRTVDVHRFNLMRKVGVRTLAELLQLWAVARHPLQV